jgi:hypothetical protein
MQSVAISRSDFRRAGLRRKIFEDAIRIPHFDSGVGAIYPKLGDFRPAPLDFSTREP